MSEEKCNVGRSAPAVAPPSPGSGLWCIHITGADEYYAKASKDDAEDAAQKFREWFDRQEKDENTPIMVASVLPWPGDEAAHTASIERQRPAADLNSD